MRFISCTAGVRFGEGPRQTGPIGVQLRVSRLQRSGGLSRARGHQRSESREVLSSLGMAVEEVVFAAMRHGAQRLFRRGVVEGQRRVFEDVTGRGNGSQTGHPSCS